MPVLLAACATKPIEVEEPIDFSKRGRVVNGPDGARLIFPDGLLFEFGKSTLRPEFASAVDACVPIIERARGNIIVEGHTDSRGSRIVNMKLSDERAKAVRTALIDRRVAPSRIETRALADAKPEVRNATTEEQMALNRRAEVIFKGETLESLDAPYGCGGPPVKRQIQQDKGLIPF